MEWLLNPVNKGKYKKKRRRLLSVIVFLCIILFGTFLGKALHQPVNVGVK